MRYGSEFRDSEYCGMDSLFLPLQIGSCTNNIGTNRLRLSGLCPGSSSKTLLSSNHTGYVKQPSDIEFMLKMWYYEFVQNGSHNICQGEWRVPYGKYFDFQSGKLSNTMSGNINRNPLGSLNSPV